MVREASKAAEKDVQPGEVRALVRSIEYELQRTLKRHATKLESDKIRFVDTTALPKLLESPRARQPSR